MNKGFIPSPIDLPKGKVLRIEGGEGTLVQVWEGEIWLTQDRCSKDHLVSAGQWFRLDRDGLAIACSLKRSVLSVSAPVREKSANRVMQALRSVFAMA
jgi:hypothetical protein